MAFNVFNLQILLEIKSFLQINQLTQTIVFNIYCLQLISSKYYAHSESEATVEKKKYESLFPQVLTFVL